MKNILPTLLLSSLALLGGCAYGDKVTFDSVNRPAKSASSVQVYDKSDLTRPHKVIGLVSATATTMQKALDTCRAEAAKMGADAIDGFGPKNTDSTFCYSAKAIVWK